MAEGLSKKHLGFMAHFYSAGLVNKAADPLAVQALHKHEVDMSKEKSKTVQDLANISFDFVIALCPNMPLQQPAFAKARVVQHIFDDPQKMAEKFEKSVDKMRCYTDACDEIESFITELPKIYPQYF